MQYDEYIHNWENDLFDVAEYERPEKYTFACLKRVRHKLATTLQNGEECTEELLLEILLHLNAIHSNFSYIEKEFDSDTTKQS